MNHFFCRLLAMALSLLQAEGQTPGQVHSIERSVLRERVYTSTFDYFSQQSPFPLQRGPDLREHIMAVVKFWNMMHSDKKFLKPDNVSLGGSLGESPSVPTLPGDLATVPSLSRLSTTPEYGSQSMLPQYKQQHGFINTLSNRSTVSKKSAIQKGDSTNANNLLKEYYRKRHLILVLVGYEIDRLLTWYNPLAEPELEIPGAAKITQWMSQSQSDKQWRELAQISWEISPTLAVFMPQRFRSQEALMKEVTRLVRTHPESVSHIPQAVCYLATTHSVEADAPELTHLLTWTQVPPVMALSYFSKRQFPPHPLTHQFAVRILKSYPAESLLFYVPQLVQSLRYDTMGYIQEYILWAASQSQLLAHQFIWNMRTNIFRDEDSTRYDEELGEIIEGLIEQIKQSLSGAARNFFDREFEFFFKVTDVSRIIKPAAKGAERKNACLKALAEVKISPGCYLPSNPEAVVLDIDYKSATPMQSAAKAPFLARFRVRRCGVKEMEEMGLQEQEAIPDSFHNTSSLDSREGSNVSWQACIFKVGDDVRQDILALQIISLFKNICANVGLDIFLFPYRVVATSPGCGVIECVPNAKSRDQIGRQTDIGMYEYFLTKFGDETSTTFQAARRNFVTSMAGYSVLTFLLQIKDRHNGNIMLDEEGHVIHIDFGFMFESSPAGNMGFEPHFKLSEEMILIMGGAKEAPPFRWFEELCVQGYLALRPHQEQIVSLVSLMLDTGLPCFRGQTIKQLRARFQPQANEREAANYMMKVIHECFSNWRAKTYDMIQYVQNQIPY